MGEYDRAFDVLNDSNIDLGRTKARVFYDTGKRPWPSFFGIVALQVLCDAGYTRVSGEPAAWALDLACRLREQEALLRYGTKANYGSDSWRSTENLAIAQMLMSKPGAIPPPVARATPTPAPAASIAPSASTPAAAPATSAAKSIDFSAIDAARTRVAAALQDLDAAIAAARRG